MGKKMGLVVAVLFGLALGVGFLFYVRQERIAYDIAWKTSPGGVVEMIVTPAQGRGVPKTKGVPAGVGITVEDPDTIRVTSATSLREPDLEWALLDPEIDARRFGIMGEVQVEGNGVQLGFATSYLGSESLDMNGWTRVFRQRSAEWQPFVVSEFCRDVPGRVMHLGLVMHVESGAIRLRHLRVVEYPHWIGWGGTSASPDSRSWWSDRAAGWIGSVGGVLVGLIGAFLGFMGCRRAMSGWIEGALVVMTLAGGLLLIVGGVALTCRQPYGVWYPLLLFGMVMAAVFGLNWALFRRKRREIELRRMASLDSAEG